MECSLNFISFVYLMTIIVIMYFNISPIICYDIDVTNDNKDSNDFLIQSTEQEHQHSPITFTYGKSDKFPWIQKSFNNIESERLPSSPIIVGLQQQQQSNQEYTNSWDKQNHYKHDNGNHNFNAAKRNNGLTKFNDDSDADGDDIYGIPNNDIYGISKNNNKRNALTNNGLRYVNQPKKSHQPQSLCQIKEQRVSLETNTHIYRPDHYIEKECVHPTAFITSTSSKGDINELCSSSISSSTSTSSSTRKIYGCVTKTSTIFLTRKLKGTDCWQTDTRDNVPTGCECMIRSEPLIDITKLY